MKEIWKDIDGFEELYQISNFGRVFSKRRNKVMKLNSRKNYLRVGFNKDGIYYCFQVHRLVAQAFIPNPDNKEEVNHIDCNKQNNVVSNLEWVTHEENMEHACNNDLIHRTKVKVYINGKEKGIYKSLAKVSFALRIEYDKIRRCLLKNKQLILNGKTFYFEIVNSLV